MQTYAAIDQQKLTFGNYATRRFCRLQGCTNDATSILQEFAGPNRGDALFNIVKAGLEAQYAIDKQPFTLDDADVSDFVDKIEGDPAKQDEVVYAFIGSVINKPATEVPAWIEEVKAEAERLAAEEQAKAVQPQATDEPKNAKAGKTSSATKTSSPAPTATV